VSSPYRWNLSNLYATGQVTLAAIPEPASIAIAAIAVGVLRLRRFNAANPSFRFRRRAMAEASNCAEAVVRGGVGDRSC
jgi:hypothetical protein